MVSGSVTALEMVRSRDRGTRIKDGRPSVLALVHLPPPVHGVTLMNELVARSTKLRARVALDIFPLRFAESIDDVGRVRLAKLGRLVGFIVRLIRKCTTDRPIVAYMTLAPVGWAFYRDVLIATTLRVFRIPTVFHLHGKGIRAGGKRWTNRRMYKSAFKGSYVVHLSPRLVDDVLEYVPRDRVFTLWNGIPDPVMGAVRNNRKSNEPVHIVYLSNMALEKGPLVLLGALNLLLRRGVVFRASFAGAWARDTCRSQFEDLLKRHALASRVCYLGPVYGGRKEALLGDADVLAFPTYYPAECFPLVLLEAMGFGLPVVSTPEGAISDIVVDGVTGFLVSQRDEHALAERLETLIADPGLRQRLGANGRRRYVECFTSARFEEGLAQILEEVCRREGGQAPVLASDREHEEAIRS